MAELSPYDPAAIQTRWNAFWEAKGYFHSEPRADRTPYAIVIPPPNVTGALHLGHALNGTLQDVMIRLRRMQGFETLWMPGADHAGIATQAVVEKRIFEQERKTRHDLGREELVRRIWAWKDEFEARIVRQLKAMGASCDWARWRFTLDDICARAVRQTFFRMFRDGLIYRGKRLVNWDTQLQTAVADDEVYHEEVQGHLWHFKYPVEGTSTFLVVATTRPETMLGDTAVAVHPEDERYRGLIGKQVRLPLMDRLIPILGDSELVDPKFGTGVVKVTPAHDPNDYACGLRHGLAMINILTPDGKINANGGKYQGMSREQARKAVAADLEALGLVEKVEPHRHAVGHSDRSKTAIEPYLSDQWFVRMGDLEGGVLLADGRRKPGLAQAAIDAVKEGRVRIHPARYADTYIAWLAEKRDWCISRQLWWGHQIPIWHCATADVALLNRAFERRSDVVFRYDDEHQAWLLCATTDLADDALAGHALRRDSDVLDTWFSSALWPHSTMGWPERTPELEYYYPTSLLSTAREIISLWVARMVIMSEYNLGQVPFRDVFVHPVIQDGNGMPMKKSLGNGVDPFDIIDKYGADAMRYTLTAMTTETQDVRMPVKKEKLADGREVNTSERFEIGRNFGTKIYNASKLILMNLEGYRAGPVSEGLAPLEDRWILSRLTRAARGVSDAFDRFQFSEAARTLYEFFWGELCDWYLEIVKPRFRDPELRPAAQRMAAWVLDHALRLLHPVMPYVTEEVWHALHEAAPRRGWDALETPAESLAIAPWPPCPEAWLDDDAEQQMGVVQDVIRAVRNVRSQFAVDPKAEVAVRVACETSLAEVLHSQLDTLRQLAKVSGFEAAPGLERPAKSAAVVFPHSKVFVPLAELIDVEAEMGRQAKKLADLDKRLAGVRSKLASENFVGKAPPEVVEQQRQLQAELEQQREAVEQILRELRG